MVYLFIVEDMFYFCQMLYALEQNLITLYQEWLKY